MKDVFFLMMLGAMLAVVGALLVGVFSMARGQTGRSQKLMRWRVGLQGLALLLSALAFLFKS